MQNPMVSTTLGAEGRRDWHDPIAAASVPACAGVGRVTRAATLCGPSMLVMLLSVGCARDRTVTVMWNSPGIIPPKYRILIDGRIVKEMPRPESDALCHCMRVQVEVPPGPHALRVEACTANNECNASADTWTE